MREILEKTTYSVYAIRCKENNKIYIGISKNPSERIEQHFRELRNGLKSEKMCRLKNAQKRDESIWQKDFDKYGEEGFECYILEKDIAYLRAQEKEAFYIAMYDSANSQFGYNLYSEHRKLKIPRLDKPPVTADLLLRTIANIDFISVELETVVDGLTETYSGENQSVCAFVMHLQRIVEELKKEVDVYETSNQ